MKRCIFTVLVILFLTASASASYVNFRLSAFSGANGAPYFTYTTIDGLGLTLTALPAGPAVLWQDGNDGIGINSTISYEPDEIEGPEILQLDFSETVYLKRVHLTDLFNEWGYLEIGYLSPNGTTTKTVTADPTQISSPVTNGELWVDFGPNLMADYILFNAPGDLNGQHHEYSLGGVDVSVVPIPPTVLLLGAGLVGLVGIRRVYRK